MAEEKRYRIIIAPSARNRYQYTVLPYLMRNFSPKRVEEIDERLNREVRQLEKYPLRGTIQEGFVRVKKQVRYILLRETRHFELKIVYLVEEEELLVRVTDFFPTMMHPKRIRGGGEA
jgi:hypothetical protein